MKLLRQSFSKHYCPRCGSRVRRVRPSALEAFIRDALFLALITLVFFVLGFFIEAFGGPEFLAWLAAALVVWVAANPIYFRLSTFQCGACGYVAESSEVKSRGWSLIT
jgi:predicted RNA-binding Zn-ribbon protein involved in translation (DUF1610 family)